MIVPLRRVSYRDLNARQKESYNFQNVSGVLAEYGFVTIRLSNDWNGADFLAQHRSGETLLVQLKARLTFDRKYQHRDLWVCFPDGDGCYLFPHDEFLRKVLAGRRVVGKSSSWRVHGWYSFQHLSKRMRAALADYRLPPATPPASCTPKSR